MYPTMTKAMTYANTYTSFPLIETLPYLDTSIEDLYLAYRAPNTSLFEIHNETLDFSILCLPYRSCIVSDGKTTTIESLNNIETSTLSPYALIDSLLQKEQPDYFKLPVFTGGLVGHINYDAIRLTESIEDHLPSLHLPLLQLGEVSELLLVDHQKQLLHFISYITPTSQLPLEQAYQEASDHIAHMLEVYHHLPTHSFAPLIARSMTSTISKQRFIETVETAKQHILAGDIFQIVLSQRLSCPYEEDPFLTYHALRQTGHTPYLYYLQFSTYSMVGASPEVLLQGNQTQIMSMPIAGTRKRGATLEEDFTLEESLKADQKENAEHDMLVDLGRNDIGKVSMPGSVRLTQYKQVKRYSHVMHLCSEVQGILRQDYTICDALASLLPAGTLSGAPKIRAMQLIEALENTKREVYGGVIALFDHQQQHTFLITIRTILFYQQMAYVQAGAGIVQDSIPENEYAETLQKASMLLQALHAEVTK